MKKKPQVGIDFKLVKVSTQKSQSGKTNNLHHIDLSKIQIPDNSLCNDEEKSIENCLEELDANNNLEVKIVDQSNIVDQSERPEGKENTAGLGMSVNIYE